MTQTNIALVSFSMLSTIALGCNAHDLKSTDYDNWGDEEGLDEASGDDADDAAGDDEGASADGGDDDGSFPGDDDGGDDGDVPVDCGGDSVTLASAPANVMLVIDKSGSMHSNTWDHDDDHATPEVTRWSSLHGVVADLVATHGSTMNLGAALFPAAGADMHDGADGACSMADEAEVDIAANGGDAIMAALPGADAEVNGGTPTRRGIMNALDRLVEIEGNGPRAMILMTDGAANCVDGADPFYSQYDTELPTLVRDAYVDERIPTYVVGIDIRNEPEENTGRNVHDDINAVADAGGVARLGADKYYNTASELDLAAALDTIAASVECTVTLKDLPASPESVTLTIGDASYPQVDACGEADGWRFTGASAPWDTIQLCGGACDAFREAGRLETTYACMPVG